jgi:hypothetical protein
MPGSWQSVPRAVLEVFFGRGLLAVADRRPNFARAYDLSERIVPLKHHSHRVDDLDARRRLLLQAAAALGVATARDIADYFRMKSAEVMPRLRELLDAGQLQQVRVEGWRETAYLHPNALLPSRIEARSLLSPFDPLIWHRQRAARLFAFDYRFEIFVPQAKRRWGTYVLPFLFGDRLVARVDLKSDRKTRTLHVLAAFSEPDSNTGAVAEALAVELRTLADWLNLSGIAVSRRGDLARRLAAACRRFA